MVARESTLPNRIEPDAIAEALLEIRFEQSSLPEIFYGRMFDSQRWKGRLGKPTRTGAEKIPEQFRSADPNLKFAPIFHASGTDNNLLRLGPHAASYHQRAPYPGWARFRPELENLVRAVFETADDVQISRLGFRYVNALSVRAHGIATAADLDMEVSIAGDKISDALNLNAEFDVGRETKVTIRVATRSFVQGDIPEDTSVVVDVDVYSEMMNPITDSESVMDWIDFAHEVEKREFFHLFLQSSIDRWTKE